VTELKYCTNLSYSIRTNTQKN